MSETVTLTLPEDVAQSARAVAMSTDRPDLPTFDGRDVREHAIAADEAIRAINHITGWSHGMTYPSDAYTAVSNLDIARLPIPGNAEFLFVVLALILLAIIAAIADTIGVGNWVDVFKWFGSAYLLSRGIAKASRVLEQ